MHLTLKLSDMMPTARRSLRTTTPRGTFRSVGAKLKMPDDAALDQPVGHRLGVGRRHGQDRDAHALVADHGLQLVHVADRLPADLQADQLGIDVEDADHREALQLQVLVVGQGLPQVAGADDDRGLGHRDADDLLQRRHQDVHLVRAPRTAESAEIMKIVAQLAGLDVQGLGQLAAGHVLHADGLQQLQLLEVQRQPVDGGVRHVAGTSGLPHADPSLLC